MKTVTLIAYLWAGQDLQTIVLHEGLTMRECGFEIAATDGSYFTSAGRVVEITPETSLTCEVDQ
jgi:hypothetical protein